jgi:NAD(P)-dependent dehydrogenase (short-subunit alcohol dehydrogenase family)
MAYQVRRANLLWLDDVMNRACQDRIAIVTGASRGIGLAIARRLAEEGARVVLSARTLEPDPKYQGSLRESVELIRGLGGEAVAIQADVSKTEDRHRLVAEATEQLGPVDILVNNAAVTFLGPFTEFTEKRWRLMVEIQLRAPYELTQLVIPGMIERGRGWILNVSSRIAMHAVGPPFSDIDTKWGWTTYAMCKAGLDRFTTALAAEVYKDGIAVNALAPWDNVSTPGSGAHDLVEGFALEGPEHIAEAALLLCSGDPAQLTGRVAYSQPLLGEFQRRPVVRQ